MNHPKLPQYNKKQILHLKKIFLNFYINKHLIQIRQLMLYKNISHGYLKKKIILFMINLKNSLLMESYIQEEEIDNLDLH